MKTTIFPSNSDLGLAAATELLKGIRVAHSQGKNYVIGCPGGRSPISTYRALSSLVESERQSLKHVYIAMMDEYVERTSDYTFTNVKETEHFSCRRFGVKEIQEVLNAALPVAEQIPISHVFLPDAKNPQRYEALISGLGIDCFLLASGATDGHVAFNGVGTARNATTRVVPLSVETRTDNLSTFPKFTSLSEVPIFGVTVGPETIATFSKKVIMLLQGEHKRTAFRRISQADAYDSQWPATIVTECQSAQIFADSAAALA